MLVTPAPFSMLLWWVVAVDGEYCHEGFHALLDPAGPMQFERFDRGISLEAAVVDFDGAQRIGNFSHGFYKLHETGQGQLIITDLRMGQEPHYSFAFVVAERGSEVIRDSHRSYPKPPRYA